MILRVVKCGECFTVKSEKSEGGVLNKRTLVLQELGGKYEPTYGLMTIGMLENGLHMADFECCEDAVMEDFTARCKVQLISQASEIAQKVIRELIKYEG